MKIYLLPIALLAMTLAGCGDTPEELEQKLTDHLTESLKKDSDDNDALGSAIALKVRLCISKEIAINQPDTAKLLIKTDVDKYNSESFKTEHPKENEEYLTAGKKCFGKLMSSLFNEKESESKQPPQSKNVEASNTTTQEALPTKSTLNKPTFNSASELFENENSADISNGFEFIKLIEYSTKTQDKEIATTLYIKSKDWSGELTYKTFEKDKKTGWHTTSTKMLEVLEGRNALNLAPSKTPQIFDSNTQALFTIDSNWMSQGESGEGKQVYLFNKSNNNWNNLGYLKIGEDNSGAYESDDPKSYTNTGTIDVNKDSLSNGLPDITIKRTGTEWKDGAVKPITYDSVYTLKDGKYLELKKNITP